MEKQIIGLDIGRGYVKAFSRFDGEEYVSIFNSVYGNGRPGIDYGSWNNAIALEIDKNLYFFGELAIKECMNNNTNIKDEKFMEFIFNQEDFNSTIHYLILEWIKEHSPENIKLNRFGQLV